MTGPTQPGEGSYAVVYAHSREHCKRLLRERLATFQPAIIPEDRWIIEPITPVPTDPTVHLVTQ